jgi:hypothetical protein
MTDYVPTVVPIIERLVEDFFLIHEKKTKMNSASVSVSQLCAVPSLGVKKLQLTHHRALSPRAGRQRPPANEQPSHFRKSDSVD